MWIKVACLLLMIIVSPCYCEAKTDSSSAQTQTIEIRKSEYVDSIEYDKILQKAYAHSYDIKIADYKMLISKQGIRSAQSEYYPKLFAKAGTEYTKSFRDYPVPMILGDSFINPYTRFQSLFGITLSYNLFDFGVRRGNLNIAKEEVTLNELKILQAEQDLNMLLCDTYTKILLLKTQLDLNRQILDLENKNVEYKTRLYNAKEITSIELNDATVKRNKIQNRIDEISSIAQESLNWLGFYTGEMYKIDNLKVKDLEKPNFNPNTYTDYTQSIVWKIKEKELKKKELEIGVLKKTNYPKVNVYGAYYMYGSDPSNYAQAYDNFRPSNVAVGGSINSLLFDGMKNRANIEAAKLEYQELLIERDKAIAELSTKLATMRGNSLYLQREIETSENTLTELNNKEKALHRLVSKKLASPIEENDAKIAILEEEIEHSKHAITLKGLLKGIQILTTY